MCEAPKFVITTNQPVTLDANSDSRRIFEVFINNNWQNLDVSEFFGGDFFSSYWQDEEWAKFDHFMIGCLQLFFEKGLIEIKNNKT